MLELSIVTTLYRSEKYIKEFHARITKSARKLTAQYEIIFVDDGSDDNSLIIAMEIAAADPHVRVIELSRNFGHHRAFMAGLAHCKGELIFLIDSDLEEEPEYLIPFYQKLQESNADVIYSIQENRKGEWLERSSGWLYYKIVRHFCKPKVPENVSTLRLMKKNYVKSLLLYNEHISNITFLLTLTGYKQIPLTIQKHHKGSTQYSFSRKLALLTDAIMSFSDKPLIYILKCGMGISFLSFVAILYLIIKKIAYHPVLGWTAILASIWFLSGLILFSVGLIGAYLRRILLEVKNRPNAIIRNIYETKSAPLDAHHYVEEKNI